MSSEGSGAEKCRGKRGDGMPANITMRGIFGAQGKMGKIKARRGEREEGRANTYNLSRGSPVERVWYEPCKSKRAWQLRAKSASKNPPTSPTETRALRKRGSATRAIRACRMGRKERVDGAGRGRVRGRRGGRSRSLCAATKRRRDDDEGQEKEGRAVLMPHTEPWASGRAEGIASGLASMRKEARGTAMI